MLQQDNAVRHVLQKVIAASNHGFVRLTASGENARQSAVREPVMNTVQLSTFSPSVIKHG